MAESSLRRHVACPTVAASLALICAAAVASAQTAPRRLSLDDALALAEGGSEQVAAAEAGVRRADGQITVARSELYPQLNSGFAYQRTLQTQFDRVFNQPVGPPCPGLSVQPDAPLGVRVGELERFLQCPPSFSFGGDGSDLPFGQLNTWTASLQFAQTVWNGGRVQAQERQARAGREAASIGVTTTRAQLSLDVATAYFDAALSERVVAITRAALEQAGETLRQIDAQYQVGNVPEFDVVRAGVARDSQRAALIGVEVQRDLAHLRLKQLLNLPADDSIELDVDLMQPSGAPADRWATALANAEAGYQAVERAAVAQAEAAVRGTEAAVAIARAQRRPSVSVSSGYIAYAYDRLPAFDRQDWTLTGAVSVPIFDGGRLRASEQIARANVEESAAQARLARQLAELDARSAYATYRAARATWEASAGTVQQAERASEIADVRYREGLSTQLELNDARLALERASVDRAQAARDLQVARARLALLPDLPLVPAGAGAGQPGGTPPPEPIVAPRPMTAPLPAGAPGQAAPGGTGASGAPGAR